jgi:hypothetical protein
MPPTDPYAARRLAVVAAIGLALAGCHHHQRAELEIVLHIREDPSAFRFVGDGYGVHINITTIHWSIDLVEVGGRNCVVTSIDQVIHYSGGERSMHQEAQSDPLTEIDRLYGVSFDSRPDYFVAFDPTVRGYGTRKLSSDAWSTSWSYVPPPDRKETLVVEMTVRYRDSEGERVTHRTFGPGLHIDG